MGFLSDGARNAYRKAGGSAYVPDWYRNAIWVGAVIAAGGIFLAAAFNDNDAPPSTYSQGVPSGSVLNTEPSQGAAQSDVSDLVSLRGVDGARYDVPRAALDVAASAGLALWTGDWEGVPVTGDLPGTSATFPQARLGTARVVSADADAVSLLFELQEDGDGTVTQEFQVTVVATGDGWAYPAFGG
jgi:hypothetical protein